MAPSQMSIMITLTNDYINWPSAIELANSGCNAVRIIAKGELCDLLLQPSRGFTRWLRQAHNSKLSLHIDLPGSRPIVASRDHGNDFQVDQEVAFIDEMTPFVPLPPRVKAVKVKNLTYTMAYVHEGTILEIADSACIFRVDRIASSYIQTSCQHASPVDLFTRGVTLQDIELAYTSPTEQELELVSNRRLPEFSSVILSFAASKAQLDQLRNAAPHLPVMAKVESEHGCRNLIEVTSSCESIMIGRTDLCGSVGPGRLGIETERIVGGAKSLGRPVVIGSGILESLSYQTAPSLADISDLWRIHQLGANGVLISGSISVRKPLLATRMCRDMLNSFARVTALGG